MYHTELSQYLDGLTVKPDTKDKARKAITAFIEQLSQTGRTWPCETDYEDYTARSQACGYSDKTIRDNIPRIKKFFAWLQKENEPMLEYETEAIDVQAIEHNEPVELNSNTLKSKRVKGVKRVQVSVYLEPETYNILLELSKLKNNSIGDIISKAASEMAKKNAAKAERIRQALQGIEMEY